MNRTAGQMARFEGLSPENWKAICQTAELSEISIWIGACLTTGADLDTIFWRWVDNGAPCDGIA